MFSFACSWILWLLPLPLLVRVLVPKASAQVRQAMKVPFLTRLDHASFTTQSRVGQYKFKKLLITLCWVLLVVAAAGPRWLGEPIALPQTGRDIMLAVDLSGSMNIPDMELGGKQVNRLNMVKHVASDFIEKRVGDRLGLILFGTRAYLQTPLTFDRNTVSSMLGDASIGLAGQQTAIGDAIGLGIKRLMHYPKDNRILILLTDGASNAGQVGPISAAKLAAKEGIKIYTIGLGADKLVVRGLFGSQVINPSEDLDEHTLKEIATLTGGLFFRAKDTQGLEAIYRTLDKIEPVTSGNTLFRPITPLYQWPLGSALALSILYLLTRFRFSWRDETKESFS